MSEKSLPVDLRETKSIANITLDRSILPWLKGSETSNVGLWTFNDDRQILVASCISSNLAKIAEKMGQFRPTADNGFFQLIYAVAHKLFTNIPLLESPKGDFPIRYAKSGTIRVYGLLIGKREVPRLFPELGENHDLVIRIAQCIKPHQQDVYGYISTDSKSHS